MRSLLTKFAAQNGQRVASSVPPAADLPEQSPQQQTLVPSPSPLPPTKSPNSVSVNSVGILRDHKGTHTPQLQTLGDAVFSRRRPANPDAILRLPKSATTRVYKIEDRVSKTHARDGTGCPLGIPRRRGSFDVTSTRARTLLFDEELDSSDSELRNISSPTNIGFSASPITPVTGLVSVSRPARAPSAMAILPTIRAGSRAGSSFIRCSPDSAAVIEVHPAHRSDGAKENAQSAGSEDTQIKETVFKEIPSAELGRKSSRDPSSIRPGAQQSGSQGHYEGAENQEPHGRQGTQEHTSSSKQSERAEHIEHIKRRSNKEAYPILHNMTPRDQVTVKKQLNAAILRSSTYDTDAGLFLTTYKQANGQEYRIYTKEAWPSLNAAQQKKPRTVGRSSLWLSRLITSILTERYKELFSTADKREDCSISDDFNCFLFKYMRRKHCISSEMKKATKELMDTLMHYKETIHAQIFIILLKPLNHLFVEGLLELVYLQYIATDATFTVQNTQIYNIIVAKTRQMDISSRIREFFVGQLNEFKHEYKSDTVTDFVQFLVSMDSELDLVVSGQRKAVTVDREKPAEQQKLHTKSSTVLRQLDSKATKESAVEQAISPQPMPHIPPTSPDSLLSGYSPLSSAPSPLPPLHHSNVINATGHASISPSLQSPKMALTVPMESPKIIQPASSLRKIVSASVIKERDNSNKGSHSRRPSIHSECNTPRSTEILICGAEHFEKKIADDSHFEFVEKDRQVHFDTTIKGIKYTSGKGERGFHRNVLGNDSRVESTELLSFFEILKFS